MKCLLDKILINLLSLLSQNLLKFKIDTDPFEVL